MLSVKRREFIFLLGGATAWPLAARAQQPAGVPLVGLLSPLSASAAARNVAAFRQGMRDLGYLEGRNVAFALSFADGQIARLPVLANELVSLNPAVIVVGSPGAVREVHKATRTIPIVMNVILRPDGARGRRQHGATRAATSPAPGARATRR